MTPGPEATPFPGCRSHPGSQPTQLPRQALPTLSLPTARTVCLPTCCIMFPLPLLKHQLRQRGDFCPPMRALPGGQTRGSRSVGSERRSRLLAGSVLGSHCVFPAAGACFCAGCWGLEVSGLAPAPPGAADPSLGEMLARQGRCWEGGLPAGLLTITLWPFQNPHPGERRVLLSFTSQTCLTKQARFFF